MSWEKKKNPWFRSRILCPGFERNCFTRLDTENGNRLNSLYWYKAIVRCTHLVARILQHGCKFSSWLKVNKISNQTVHHQSATKFDSMPQDIYIYINYKPAKLKILSAFLILRKKNTNIFNHVNTEWLIISLLNTVIEKNYNLENRMWTQTSGWVICAKPSRRNTEPGVSHTFSRRF